MVSARHKILSALHATLAVGLLAGTLMAGEPVPSLDAADLGRGAYSTASMMLKKTILKVKVMRVDVRFGKETQERLAEAGKDSSEYSNDLGAKLANIALPAERAVVVMAFQRDVSLNMWMDGLRENLDQAKAAKLITPELRQRVSNALPDWFSALKDRGYEEGDKLVYSITADLLRVAVTAKDGKVLVDRSDKEGARKVVLPILFAPGSDFREPLLRSLVENRK